MQPILAKVLEAVRGYGRDEARSCLMAIGCHWVLTAKMASQLMAPFYIRFFDGTLLGLTCDFVFSAISLTIIY